MHDRRIHETYRTGEVSLGGRLRGSMDRHHETPTIVGSRQVKSVETHDEGSCLEVGRDYLDLGPVRANLWIGVTKITTLERPRMRGT